MVMSDWLYQISKQTTKSYNYIKTINKKNDISCYNDYTDYTPINNTDFL